MNHYIDIVNELQQKTGGILHEIKAADFEQCINRVLKAPGIFIHGAGRSGLAGRFFGMRLMQIGKQVHIVGDTTTPGIREPDLLLLISGSGMTTSVINSAQTGRKCGATIVTLTSGGASLEKNRLCRLSDQVIKIDTRGAYCREHRINPFPLGTLFELGALLFLESVIGGIILREGIEEESMRERHANLE